MEDMLYVLDAVEDEELEIPAPITRGPRRIRDRVDHFQIWDELEFFNRFRMTKNTASLVLDLIRESIQPRTMKNNALTPEVKFFTTLRFLASGNFLINVGDQSGIHISSTSKVVKEVCHHIAMLFPQVITLPSTEPELNSLKHGFYLIAKFPNVIGALDCTHVKIQSVGGDLAETYRNRKGVFSINVQAICDSNLMFNNLVARWPGSTHDCHIFNSSKVKKDFENGVYGNSVLVVDSGYACTNYSIPPLDEVVLPEEQLFQEAQVRTRNPIERCFGVWKRRFPVLSLGIRLKLDRIESVIVASAVLHNICTKQGDDVPPVSEEEEAAIAAMNEVGLNEGQHGVEDPRRNRQGGHDINLVTRNRLVYQYFRSML